MITTIAPKHTHRRRCIKRFGLAAAREQSLMPPQYHDKLSANLRTSVWLADLLWRELQDHQIFTPGIDHRTQRDIPVKRDKAAPATYRERQQIQIGNLPRTVNT